MQGTGELLSSRLGLTLLLLTTLLLTTLLLTTLLLFSSAPAHGAAAYLRRCCSFQALLPTVLLLILLPTHGACRPRHFRFLTALTPTTRPSDADTFPPSR